MEDSYVVISGKAWKPINDDLCSSDILIDAKLKNFLTFTVT